MVDLYHRVSDRIDREWYPYHLEEYFGHGDICNHFQWFEQDTRQQVSKKLYHDHKERPFLEKLGSLYRIIDQELVEMDWQSADHTKTLPLKLPFGLEEYVKFFPKSLIVIAGAPNSGKTAWLYNFILMNTIYNGTYIFSSTSTGEGEGTGEGGLQGGEGDCIYKKRRVTLYNSETSTEQMKERFLNFDMKIPTPSPFKTYERYENFSDVVRLAPDDITVVDYVDTDSDFWQNGAELSRIYYALGKGAAVVAIQKKFHQRDFKGRTIRVDTGYGGVPTLKRASLYLSMDNNILKIVKAKSWVDPQINPNGMMFSYSLVKGCKFYNIERIYEEEE